MKESNKNGIIAFLVLIIIGLASSFGYYYYTNEQNKNDEEKVATNESSDDEKGIEDNLILLAVGETVNLSDYVDDISNLENATFEDGKVFSIDDEYQITVENQGSDVLVLTYKDGKTVKYGVLCNMEMISIKIGEEGDLTTYIDKEKEVKEITSDNESFTISENKVTTTDEGEAIITIIYTDGTEDTVKVKCKTKTSNADYLVKGDSILSVDEKGNIKTWKITDKEAKNSTNNKYYRITINFPSSYLKTEYQSKTYDVIFAIPKGNYKGYYYYDMGTHTYIKIDRNLMNNKDKLSNYYVIKKSLFLVVNPYKITHHNFIGAYTGVNGKGTRFIDSSKNIIYNVNGIYSNMTIHVYISLPNSNTSTSTTKTNTNASPSNNSQKTTTSNSNPRNGIVTTPTITLKQQIYNCRNTSLKYGSSGSCVKVLKAALEKDSLVRCTGLTKDGVFRSVARNCTNKLKKAKKMKEDGIAGPKVWEILYNSTPNTIAGVQ